MQVFSILFKYEIQITKDFLRVSNCFYLNELIISNNYDNDCLFTLWCLKEIFGFVLFYNIYIFKIFYSI